MNVETADIRKRFAALPEGPLPDWKGRCWRSPWHAFYAEPFMEADRDIVEIIRMAPTDEDARWYFEYFEGKYLPGKWSEEDQLRTMIEILEHIVR